MSRHVRQLRWPWPGAAFRCPEPGSQDEQRELVWPFEPRHRNKLPSSNHKDNQAQEDGAFGHFGKLSAILVSIATKSSFAPGPPVPCSSI